jgi:sulfur carrier protein ThiS
MISQVHLRLYEELNDFLPPDRRKRRFACELNGIAKVEELLMSLEVPGDQVEIVLVNGESVDFSHTLKDGDFVSVYPVFETLDVKSLVRVRTGPLRRIRFMAGPDLRGLAHYLRLLEFDVLDSGAWTQEKIFRVAEEERRILLAVNPGLVQSPALTRAYFVRESRPRKQLIEVLKRFDLYDSVHLSRFQSMMGRIHK